MNIEDRQLDDWLRDVELPEDLRERLLALPNSVAKTEQSSKHPWTVAAAILALAASIVGVIVAVRWSNSPVEIPVAEKSADDSPDSTDRKNSAQSKIVKAMSSPLEDVRANIDFIDIMIRERAIRDLSERLEVLANAPPPNSLDSNQRASLIVSMSDQSALQLGATRAWVERDMVRVTERFPNTDGAKLAKQFIAQASIQ